MCGRVQAVVTFAVLASFTSLAFGVTTVTHPFVGVTHYERYETSPRELAIHVVEIDLNAPGIGFVTTPSNGAKPGDTTRQRTSDFVQQTGAQIAINGTFYNSAGSGVGPGGGTEYYADLTYFAYSAGVGVSTWSGTGDPDERGINVDQSNNATFIKPYAINQANYQTRPPGAMLYNGIGTYDGILINDVITATDVNLHPRTAMGLNDDDSKLFLMTVDGRQPGWSMGMTTIEVAQMLQNDYGCSNGINLDGGGSTTMVFADPTSRVLNRPSDGAERLHGNNFGVLALPIPPSVGGDYNDDGSIDAVDYVVWRKNEGTTNPLPNDPIGGMIGQAQYDQWRAHFGQSAGSGVFAVSPDTSSSIPEPTVWSLAALAGIMLVLRRSSSNKIIPEIRSLPAGAGRS